MATVTPAAFERDDTPGDDTNRVSSPTPMRNTAADKTPGARMAERVTALAAAIDAATRALDARLDAIGREVVPLREGALLEDAGAVRAATGRIQREAERARGVGAALTTLTQALTTPLHPAQIEVADLLMTIIPRWKSLAPAHSFELALTGPEPTVFADTARVEQAIMALLEYIVALTPEGGDVRVTLRERRATRDHANTRPEGNDSRDDTEQARSPLARLDALGGGAVISVRSPQARAVSAETLRRFGDPNAPASQLTGADESHDAWPLHLAQIIAAQHGAQLWIESPAIGDAPTLHLALPFTLPVQATDDPEIDHAPAYIAGAGRDALPGPGARLPVSHPQPVALIVEGDPRMARYLRANFAAQRYRPLSAATLDEALHLIDLEEPDLLLLGASLSDGEPLEAVERLLGYSGAPIIVLARNDDPLLCARAIDLGAADYVSLPFSMDELLARARAALRVASRMQAAQNEATHEPIFANGPLRVDYAQRLVTVAGRPVSLSKTEYKLLRALAQHAGMALTHETLLERVWGPAYSQEVEFIWVYVRRLRRKIELDPAHPQLILTVPGVGYRLARLP